jgi:hypothetical protein
MTTESTGYVAKLDQADLRIHHLIMKGGRSYSRAVWRFVDFQRLMDNTIVYKSASWMCNLAGLRTTWQISCTTLVRDIVGNQVVKLDAALHLSDASSSHGLTISIGLIDAGGAEHVWETFEATNNQADLQFTATKLHADLKAAADSLMPNNVLTIYVKFKYVHRQLWEGSDHAALLQVCGSRMILSQNPDHNVQQ